MVSTLYVPNDRPYGSTLTTFGLAALADRLLTGQADQQHRITVSYAGAHYELRLHPALDSRYLYVFPEDFLSFIETEKNSKTLPAEGPRWNYQLYKNQVSEYFELRRSMSPAELYSKAAPDDQPRLQRLRELEPDERWYGMAMINQMQALTAYNDVVATWRACKPHWPELLEVILLLWGDPAGNSSAALDRWQKLMKTHKLDAKESVTASQTINPEQGKGANRAKADALTVGNQSAFWLEEAMKFAGVFVAGIPRTVSGAKDRKTYVLQPRELDFAIHRRLYQSFQKQLWPATAVKLDILAALGYSRLFVQQYTAEVRHWPGLSFRPDNHVQGFATAFYKDLGSAVATMNMSVVNLPDWCSHLEGPAGAAELDELFDEHIRIIRPLDESRGEEEAMLRSYRDFLSSRDTRLNAFFDFTNRYAAHVMGKMVRRQPVSRISTKSLEVIVMSNDRRRSKPLEPILRSQGFQNIAEAIRRSTVIPQYQRNQGTTTYEIRYGLGDKLKRKANYPLQFVQELSDFMHLYNQENARVAEKSKVQFRKSITTRDIDEVARLLDEYEDDAPAVAHLLIAYGYARDATERASKTESDDLSSANLSTDKTIMADDRESPEGDDLPF